MNDIEISPEHPRAESLRIRNRLVHGYEIGITSTFGLFAHGRGEAFDYLLGEKTTGNARNAIRAAAASFITAKHPILSVNGNVAALSPNELVELAKVAKAKLEVNLYHRSVKREKAIARVLIEAGAEEIFGLDKAQQTTIPEIHSDRRHVDQRGIFTADVVFVPLEDGDRTEALAKLGKSIITVDLNPLSRTAQFATITIVDNIVRALPLLVDTIRKLGNEQESTLLKITESFDNRANLAEAIKLINSRLSHLAKASFE